MAGMVANNNINKINKYKNKNEKKNNKIVQLVRKKKLILW
jgi:hypothetical protein